MKSAFRIDDEERRFKYFSKSLRWPFLPNDHWEKLASSANLLGLFCFIPYWNIIVLQRTCPRLV